MNRKPNNYSGWEQGVIDVFWYQLKGMTILEHKENFYAVHRDRHDIIYGHFDKAANKGYIYNYGLLSSIMDMH